MKVKTLVKAMGVVCLALGISLALYATAQRRNASTGQGQKAESEDYKITGPYTHANLSVFLIHGKDKVAGKTFLTLEEAMRRRKIIVYETKDVNELAIENVSQTEEVFVQSGDIVKGGQQDRMLGVDLIVPPKSGRIKIAAYCVESGRWQKRGNEEAGKFNSSSERVATRDLKLAATVANSQSEVWEKVSEAQAKLSNNVGGRVNSTVSESSFQLALENNKVQETAEGYIKSLDGIIEGQTDVIGYAFAINGQVNSADVYVSSTLFKKLWPRLLKASAIEAIAELEKGKKYAPPKADDVKTFTDESERGAATDKDVSKRINVVTRDAPASVVLETRDRAQKEVWIHKTYIKKH